MTDAVFDPYATLGLRPGADASQVRDAYRRLARQYHPDQSSDGHATERMQAINRAREILSDPLQRASYAATARRSATPHWSSGRAARQQWAPPPASWSAGAATGATYGYGVPPYRSPMPDADGGPWWPGIVVGILLLLVIGPVLFLVVPFPLPMLFVALVLGGFGRNAGR